MLQFQFKNLYRSDPIYKVTTEAIDKFCNEFLSLRIGDRLIAENFVDFWTNAQMNDGFDSPNIKYPGGDTMIGALGSVNICELIRNTTKRLESLVESRYGVRPNIRFIENDDQTPIYIDQIPTHLRFILFETFKNAVQAHMQHGKLKSNIDVAVYRTDTGVTIHIADKGGGALDVDKIWHYNYSTSRKSYATTLKALRRLENGLPPEVEGSTNPLSGFGFGLPLSRLYCRHFGGDLILVNMRGYGCDIYIIIPELKLEENDQLSIQEDDTSSILNTQEIIGIMKDARQEMFRY